MLLGGVAASYEDYDRCICGNQVRGHKLNNSLKLTRFLSFKLLKISTHNIEKQ
jgi:hypothetical protein